jgi:hypothetical protein
MTRIELTVQIRIAQATAHIQKAAARRAFHQARGLARKAKTKADPQMHEAACAKHKEGWTFRDAADTGRSHRRALSLVAAMLHGRTYQQCEAKTETMVPFQEMARILDPCLPPAQQGLAAYLIETWRREKGTAWPELRDSEALAARIAHLKAHAELQALGEEIQQAERYLQDRLATQGQALRTVSTLRETVAATQRRLATLHCRQRQLAASIGEA